MPKIKRMTGVPRHQKSYATLFSKTNTHKSLVRDNGTHILDDQKISSFTEIVLNATDKMSPIMNKYPRIGKAILYIGEKLIKFSEKARMHM